MTFSPSKNAAKQEAPINKEEQASSSYVNSLFDDASDFSGESDERVTEAVATLNKIAKNKTEQALNHLGLNFILLDSEPLALPIIIGFNKKGPVNAMFVLLVEEGLYQGPLENEDLTINGQTVQLDVDTSKCYDKVLVNLAVQTIKAQAGIEALPNGYMVIKDGMEIVNSSYLAKLYGTVESNIRSLQGQPTPNLRQVAQSNLQMKLTHDVHPGENVHDLEGNPISADFTSTLTISVPNKTSKNDSYNRGRRSMMLAQVSGILDFIYGPTLQAKMGTHSREEWYPCVYPIVNITNCTAVDAKTKLSNETPETNLYGLLAVAQIAEKNNFLSVFRRPKTNKSSLGNLGYIWEPSTSPATQFVPHEIPLLNALGGDAKKKDGLTVDQVSDRFFHETMDFCIDIKKGSRNSWTQEFFLRAALGGADGAAANKELFDVFNDFTDGEFAKVWDVNAPMVQQNVISVHAGTYLDDKTGDARDIRDYDFLKLTSLYGKEASQQMVDYVRTMELGGSNGNEGVVNIDTRRKVLKHLTSMEVEGLYDRVILAPDLLKALLIAAKNTGITLASEGLYDPNNNQYLGGGNFRSSGTINNEGVFNDNRGPIDNSGQGGYFHRPRH